MESCLPPAAINKNKRVLSTSGIYISGGNMVLKRAPSLKEKQEAAKRRFLIKELGNALSMDQRVAQSLFRNEPITMLEQKLRTIKAFKPKQRK